MIGKGTFEDPRRPMFAPLPGSQASRAGIVSYIAQESDDGRFALVEFVAFDRTAFQPILGSGRADVRVFEKGKARKEEVLNEFRKFKANINVDRFGGRLP